VPFTIETGVFLLAIIAGIAIAAQRLKTPPSILLVLGGIILALTPGLPAVQLDPDLVLLGLLPPIIYWAGVLTSWREFRFNLRPIVLLALGLVVFTTVAVAATVHYVFAWPWAAAFLLGAIVSPPDAVAPISIARPLGIPRRLLVVLEGEGVANDATALILYRFAVAAIAVGVFSPVAAVGTFTAIILGEPAYGIAVGWASLRLRRWVGEPRVELVLSMITPFVAFWVPHEVGGSGVLATIAAGLYVSWRGPLLIPSRTRLQGIFFWDLLIYVIEGFLFLLTGLQARTLIETATLASWVSLVAITAVTAAVLVLTRFVWVFPAAYLPRLLVPGLARRDPVPPWQQIFLIAFTGVRGAVPLAAALGIPLVLSDGTPFPYRTEILAVTFGIIIVTLIGTGLSVPAVVRWLRLAGYAVDERHREREAERKARDEVLGLAQQRLREIAADRMLSQDVTDSLSSYHESLRREVNGAADGADDASFNVDLRRELIEAERQHLHRMLAEGRITDESRRRIESELDLEEATLSSRGEKE